MNWAAPLLVLPGVGLLVMSASVRYARLHDELHHLQAHPPDDASGPATPHDTAGLLRRGRLLRDALVALYGAAILLSAAGLSAGVLEQPSVTGALSVVGVALLMLGCGSLCIEAMASFRILASEVATLQRRAGGDHGDPEPPP